MSDPTLTVGSLTARAVAAPLARPLRTASGDVPVSPLLLIDVVSEEGAAGGLVGARASRPDDPAWEQRGSVPNARAVRLSMSSPATRMVDVPLGR